MLGLSFHEIKYVNIYIYYIVFAIYKSILFGIKRTATSLDAGFHKNASQANFTNQAQVPTESLQRTVQLIWCV